MDAVDYLAYLTVKAYVDELRGETARPTGADRRDSSARRRRLRRRGND